MTTFSVGDSIAAGLGSSDAVDKAFARGGIPVGAEMGDYFMQVAAQAGAGDTVIVSGGYNGGDVSRITDWIKPMTEKGVNVRILGLREKGLTAPDGGYAPYAHLDGKTEILNDRLREVARRSGAVFSESSIQVANTIAGHEIHGNFRELAAAALGAAPAETPDVTPAKVSFAPLKPPEENAVTEGQKLLREIDSDLGHVRYDLGRFGVKHDGVDGVKGRVTKAAFEKYEDDHGLRHDTPLDVLVADMRKTVAAAHGETGEPSSSAPHGLPARGGPVLIPGKLRS